MQIFKRSLKSWWESYACMQPFSTDIDALNCEYLIYRYIY